MAYKGTDGPLNDLLLKATEKEVLDDINKLIDKKLYLALAKVIAEKPDASTVLSDPDIQAESNRLKERVADVISSHEGIITGIAKEKIDAPDVKPSGTS